MIKKINAIFMRDLKVNANDFIALYIIVFPVLFALVINLITPSLNDTTINLGFVAGQDEAAYYFEQFAYGEVLPDRAALDERVLRRDAFFGVVEQNGQLVLVAQGNEPEQTRDYAKLLLTFYKNGVKLSDSAAQIVYVDRLVPPLKKTLVNGALMLVSVLGGMLILMNIIEEKVDNTISAIHLTTVPRWAYIVGKSLVGIIIPIVGSVIMLYMTGFRHINFLQMIIVMLSLSLLSIVIGFIMGLTNDDVMNAAGNMKLLFLPLMAAVAAIEMLGPNWQKFFYWIPFYWAYKANDIVLSGLDDWPKLLSYSGLVVLISGLVVALLAPRIKKGLQ